MNNAFYQLQMPANEPVNTYAPGTAARASLKATEKCRCQRPQDTEVLPGHMVACHYPEEY